MGWIIVIAVWVFFWVIACLIIGFLEHNDFVKIPFIILIPILSILWFSLPITVALFGEPIFGYFVGLFMALPVLGVGGSGFAYGR